MDVRLPKISGLEAFGAIRKLDSTLPAQRRWVREVISTENRKDLFHNLMDRFGGIVIGEALNLNDGDRSRAAKVIGLPGPPFSPRSKHTTSCSRHR